MATKTLKIQRGSGARGLSHEQAWVHQQHHHDTCIPQAMGWEGLTKGLCMISKDRIKRADGTMDIMRWNGKAKAWVLIVHPRRVEDSAWDDARDLVAITTPPGGRPVRYDSGKPGRSKRSRCDATI